MSPEDPPPEDFCNWVVFPLCLKCPVMCQGVVDPPETSGHEVGKEDVYGVVAPRYHQEHYPADGGQEGEPVQKEEGAGRIWT